MFQNFALLTDHTVYENVELPLLYRNKTSKNKISSKEIKNKVSKAIEKVELTQHINKYPFQLSGGQQQRVAIARAMICEPSVILADEPTGALDQNMGKEIMKLLCELNKSGNTLIIVTHDEKIAQYCSRRIEIMDGNINHDSGVVATKSFMCYNSCGKEYNQARGAFNG